MHAYASSHWILFFKPDPLSLVRFIIPPSRLLSAAMWQVTEQRQVQHYGMLEEFVTMVTESVPELAFELKLIDVFNGLYTLQVVHEDMGESEACFLNLIRTFISNPKEREHFFQVTNT